MGVRRRLTLAVLLALPAAQPFAQGASSPAAAQRTCAPAPTALVLSGGAAKGFAHIGVLQVLDSLGLKPDLIVGTSVGALIGSLYASGYSAHEVDSVMRALPFSSVIRSYEPTVSRSLGLVKPLAVWERGRTGYRLQTGGARESEVNAFISAITLRGNLIARGVFDSLPIAFRAVATDLLTRDPVVMGTGDLGFAVRASVALPLLFQPVRRDTTWLIDGALASNTPVTIARMLGAQRVWASRLPYALPDRNAFDDPLTLSQALVNSLFKEDDAAERYGDVNVVNPTHHTDPLDFSRGAADSLTQAGHEAARAAFAAATCLRPANAATGSRPSGRSLPARITSVTITSIAPDARAVVNGLGIEPAGTVDLDRARRAIAELGQSERISAVWLNPGGRGDEVSFSPTLEPAPRRAFGIGVAFDQFMSGRFWIGGVDHSVKGTNAEAVVLAHFGAYEQDVDGFVRVNADALGGHRPIAAGVRLAHESVRLFTDSGELPNAETNEAEAYVGQRDDAVAGAWRFEMMLDARGWREPGRNARGSVGVRTAVFRGRNDYEMGSIVEAVALTDYQYVRVDASRQFAWLGLETRFRVRAGWGNRLPVQHTFTLGGSDGFAGLRIGDVRGDEEAYGALRLKRRIAPQLNIAVEGMAGAVGSGPGFLTRRDSSYFGKVYAGVRVGIETQTLIGPIRVEEGFSNIGTRALLVRVGYWF